ncbi:MAG: ATP-binding protein [archaeon]|nr:ATP-binding protein [archaeon]
MTENKTIDDHVPLGLYEDALTDLRKERDERREIFNEYKKLTDRFETIAKRVEKVSGESERYKTMLIEQLNGLLTLQKRYDGLKAFSKDRIQELREARSELKILQDYVEHLEEELEELKEKSTPAEGEEDSKISIAVEKTYFSDVGGLDSVLEEIETFKYGIEHPEAFQEYGRKPPRSLMMYGPPGTGKTTIAKAIATELGVKFASIQSSDILEKWFGEAERKLAHYLDQFNAYALKNNTKVIVFFDEAEALMTRRGSSEGYNGADRVVTVLNNYLEGLYPTDGLIFIAATNMIESIDPALLRDGRFSTKIEIPKPSREGVEDILRKLIAAQERKRLEFITDDVEIDPDQPEFIFPDLDYSTIADQMFKRDFVGVNIAGVINRSIDNKIMELKRAKEIESPDTLDRIIHTPDLLEIVKVHVLVDDLGKNKGAGKKIEGFLRD